MRLAGCNRVATCVCAVMVRAAKSLYVIDSCGERYRYGFHKGRYAPRAKLYDCDEGRNEMLLEHKGNQFKVNISDGELWSALYGQTHMLFHTYVQFLLCCFLSCPATKLRNEKKERIKSLCPQLWQTCTRKEYLF